MNEQPRVGGALSHEREHIFGTPSSEIYSVYRREMDRKSGDSVGVSAIQSLGRLLSIVLVFAIVCSVFALFIFLTKEGFFILGLKKFATRLPGSEAEESDSIFDFVHKQIEVQGSDSESDEVYSELQLQAEEQLGVLLTQVSDSSAELYRLPLGVAVERISGGTSVFVSGIREGDVITQVNDSRVLTVEDFLSEISYIAQADSGENITLSVYRDGANFSIMCFCSGSEAAAAAVKLHGN